MLKSFKTAVCKVEHDNNIGAGVSTGPVWHVCGHSHSPPGDAGALDLAAGQRVPADTSVRAHRRFPTSARVVRPVLCCRVAGPGNRRTCRLHHSPAWHAPFRYLKYVEFVLLFN